MSAQLSGLPPDSLLRIDRASQHIKVLERSLRRFFEPDGRKETKPYVLVRKPHPSAGDDFLLVEQTRATPASFALLVSDTIHQLRSALDNLAFALSEAPECGRGSVAFPILSVNPEDSRKLRRSFDSCVDGISDEAKAVIQGVQPYVRPDNWEAGRKYVPDEHNLLAILRTISNADKHHSLRTFLLSSSKGYVISGGSAVHSPRLGSLADQAPIARVAAGTPSDYNVEMNFRPFISVAIDSPGAKNDTIDALLRIMRNHVQEVVLPQFEPFFQDGNLIRPWLAAFAMPAHWPTVSPSAARPLPVEQVEIRLIGISLVALLSGGFNQETGLDKSLDEFPRSPEGSLSRSATTLMLTTG